MMSPIFSTVPTMGAAVGSDLRRIVQGLAPAGPAAWAGPPRRRRPRPATSPRSAILNRSVAVSTMSPTARFFSRIVPASGPAARPGPRTSPLGLSCEARLRCGSPRPRRGWRRSPRRTAARHGASARRGRRRSRPPRRCGGPLAEVPLGDRLVLEEVLQPGEGLLLHPQPGQGVDVLALLLAEVAAPEDGQDLPLLDTVAEPDRPRLGRPPSVPSEESAISPSSTTSPTNRVWTWARRLVSSASEPDRLMVRGRLDSVAGTVRIPRAPTTSSGTRTAFGNSPARPTRAESRGRLPPPGRRDRTAHPTRGRRPRGTCDLIQLDPTR